MRGPGESLQTSWVSQSGQLAILAAAGRTSSSASSALTGSDMGCRWSTFNPLNQYELLGRVIQLIESPAKISCRGSLSNVHPLRLRDASSCCTIRLLTLAQFSSVQGPDQPGSAQCAQWAQGEQLWARPEHKHCCTLLILAAAEATCRDALCSFFSREENDHTVWNSHFSACKI
jgi:hypothetical protein